MVILINGAFGVGKTTVARLVARRLGHTAVFDPELIGFVVQRLRRIAGRPVEDFQDVALWRRLVVVGVHATAKIHENVVIPMAFSNLAYLEEIRAGIARFERTVRHFCLVAPIEVVLERLSCRDNGAGEQDLNWQYRRATECCVAHRDAAFGKHVSTLGLTAAEVADHVLASIS